MKRITLQAWAQRSLNIEPTPCYRTLLRWIHAELIYPKPEKVGRAYFVERDAIVLGDDPMAIVRYHAKRQEHA